MNAKLLAPYCIVQQADLVRSECSAREATL